MLKLHITVNFTYSVLPWTLFCSILH